VRRSSPQCRRAGKPPPDLKHPLPPHLRISTRIWAASLRGRRRQGPAGAVSSPAASLRWGRERVGGKDRAHAAENSLRGRVSERQLPCFSFAGRQTPSGLVCLRPPRLGKRHDPQWYPGPGINTAPQKKSLFPLFRTPAQSRPKTTHAPQSWPVKNPRLTRRGTRVEKSSRRSCATPRVRLEGWLWGSAAPSWAQIRVWHHF
jgi:hypothetical protein